MKREYLQYIYSYALLYQRRFNSTVSVETKIFHKTLSTTRVANKVVICTSRFVHVPHTKQQFVRLPNTKQQFVRVPNTKQQQRKTKPHRVFRL